ncbi:MAG: SUMF1/EgtB/PvdO family nonheme iron enzyme [Roseofilum sp. SBFL]|uniref:bifunctional serine/threonine-protein kinase/formylglycine-generating enzyme family protein n=1 Tax=unclassified Roseofilum TaxID=2620099 RepID=UPI001B0E0388|nr:MULTISPECIES: bifunctional serine/threonine-protein kinase/formylglycine-generating enzyme family protein [unclassified Roseofilum]MBP0013881.1 SUMF1/EgtB/PvdO family nonheme iron enzyme [Roseofilum sp. SID3]MBP0026476.1 SUMF1/EgtB/PvdO family nonheme iron enzyme [Roseofilum sp. SID2]MBP0039565.1 SUMF1/EgtB/PvdO family nonheme iron enzyme [Roseofilum sp. SID1]MBP0043040.1 SUMF1/EgtB/PvdO family nonheme iron enzyme [Roseofilum sp. SBFL]
MSQPLASHYQIAKQLGRGGFGITYQAQDLHLPGHPFCVVKRLQPKYNDPKSLKLAKRLFETEAQTLQQLGSHEQIPRLLAYFTESGEFYLVQEYIKGYDLTQEIQPGKCWSEEQVLRLLEGILTPLEFVHQNGVIHRDIKPANLMRRSSDNQIVLIDFGPVKQVLSQLNQQGGHTSFTVGIGTPGYQPSEQAAGTPKFASDIYAVGITGIEALTGKPSHDLKPDSNTGEIMLQNLAPNASTGLRRVLQKMVYYDFRHRYSSATEALREVKELRGSTLPPPPPPLPPPPPPNNPTRRRVIQGVSLVGMGVVGSLLARSVMDGWGGETGFEPEISPEVEPSPELQPIVEAPPEPEPVPEPEEPQLPIFRFEVMTVNRRGEIIARENQQAPYFQENLGEGIRLDMVAIPGGRFLMGSPPGEGYDDERPQHSVTVQPFYMGKFLITQAQWRRVASLAKVKRDLESNPSYFKGDNLPVEGVSWYSCEEFCARLSRYMGKSYGLPSEAQWEYGCRARTSTPFHFGETLTTDLANYDGNYPYADAPKGEYRQKTTPVGRFMPNGFGLYDMHGNLWEWCADHWHENYNGAPTDGSIWLSSGEESNRPVRGGSWNFNSDGCRSRYRVSGAADSGLGDTGFRVVCPLAMTP